MCSAPAGRMPLLCIGYSCRFATPAKHESERTLVAAATVGGEWSEPGEGLRPNFSGQGTASRRFYVRKPCRRVAKAIRALASAYRSLAACVAILDTSLGRGQN